MSKVNTYQSSFNMGVLSPELASRVDIDQYYRGAKTIKNGIVLPTGGVKKRNGFELIAEVQDLADEEYSLDTAGVFDVGVFKLNHNGSVVRDIPYKSINEEFSVLISQDGLIQIVAKTGDIVYGPVRTDKIYGDAVKDLQYKQVANDLVILSRYFRPFIVIKESTGFTLKDITDLTIPQVTFDRTVSVGIWNEVTITFDGMENGDEFTLGYDTQVKGLYQVDQLPLTGDNPICGEDAAQMAADLETALNIVIAGHTVTPDYTNTPQLVRDSLGALVEVTVQKFKGLVITKPDQTKLFCLSKSSHYAEVRAMPTGGTYTEVEIEEDGWSDDRGWPSVAGEHDGRFIMAATIELPVTVWFSRISAYYDFVPTDPNNLVATDPLDRTIAADTSSRITGIIDSRRLTLITTDTAYTMEGTDGVIIPDGVEINNIDQKGAKLIRPFVLDGNLFYVQKDGAELSSTVYNYTTDSYASQQASIYSSHLLNEVQQLAKTLSNGEFNAEYLTIMNRDGTLAMYSSLKEQQLQNWTEIDTAGQFVDIAGIDSSVYGLVRRGTTGNTRITLEAMTTTAGLCDMSQRFTSSTEFTEVGGFDRFIGETLVALADNYDIELVVDAEGVVTLPFGTKDLIIGLPFDYEIEPMPLNAQLQSGHIVDTIKRITEARITLLESRNVTLEYAGKDYKITDRLTNFAFGEPPEPYTGIKIKRLTGWIRSGSVKIKSSRPVQVIVLGLLLKVRVKG